MMAFVLCRACAEAPEGGPAGTQACNQPNSQTYNNGASYASTWGWNIGGQFKLEASEPRCSSLSSLMPCRRAVVHAVCMHANSAHRLQAARICTL